METTLAIILTVIMSVAVGLLMGIIGGGGGAIFILILLIFLKQNAKTAAMTALVLATMTLCGATWQYWKKKQFRKDYFIVLAIFDIVGTVLGNVLLNHISELVVKIAIFCVLALSGLSSLLKVKAPKQSDDDIPRVSKKLPVTASIGLVSGLATGTTGLSGNTMVSSYLIGLLNFSPYVAIGTATLFNFVGNVLSISVLCLSSCLFHVTSLYIDVQSLFTLGIGSAVGAFFGAKLTTKIDRRILTIILAAIAILPGIYLLITK